MTVRSTQRNWDHLYDDTSLWRSNAADMSKKRTLIVKGAGNRYRLQCWTSSFSPSFLSFHSGPPFTFTFYFSLFFPSHRSLADMPIIRNGGSPTGMVSPVAHVNARDVDRSTFEFGERLGIVFIAESAGLSVLAVTTLLCYILVSFP